MNLDQRLLHQLPSVRVQLALTVSLGLLAGILLVVQAFLLSQTVSRVFLDEQTLHDVRSLLGGLLVIAAARAVALWGSEIAACHVSGQIKADLRERLFAHLIALGPAYTRGERSGELANTAAEGIEALDAYFSQYIPQLALAALVPLTMLLVVFPLDLLSGLVLLLTAPMIPIFMVLIGSLANTQSRKQWTLLSRMSAHFLDVLQGLTTLKLFGRSREQARQIARISDQFRDTTMSVLRIAFLSAFALEMLATISTAIIAVEIGLRLLYGRIVFDEAFFILILAPEYYGPLRMLGARFHAGISGVAASRRIFEVLSLTPQVGQDAASSVLTEKDGSPFIICFEGVFYAYTLDERPALNGVSFMIQPGQKVALVGRSGVGKSTAAQLLLRFIEPTAGQITVNGRDLRTIPADVWREQVAWVPQLPYLFAASLMDNIRLARPEAPLEDVIRAAQLAHADEFIRAFPDGYETLIGERGARLSGGQAQRIALARAFLKNAPVLILDETTSNLDPATEMQIQEAIRTLMRDRTVLIIAHRLGTVKDADQIVVLNNGYLAEVGTHQELIARGSVYRQLIAADEDG
jgi:ATP-binding cassette subfamily C protein CydD